MTISNPGIIWKPIWGSFAVRGSFVGWGHLQAFTDLYYMESSASGQYAANSVF